jgi:hypothetical protein
MTLLFLKVILSFFFKFQDNCELSNHLLENVKPFVNVITKPANKIITNTIKEVNAVEPNFQKDFFKELNIPKYDVTTTPLTETFNELLKPLTEEIGKRGGIENINSSYQEVKKEQEETMEVLRSIVKETREKLKL